MNMSENARFIAGIVTKKHGFGPVKDISPITGRGEVNHVLLVTTESHTFILRINTAQELDRFRKEAACMLAVRNLGVLVPNVLEIDSYGDLSYSAQEYIEGNNGTDIQQSDALWIQLGASLAAIHKVAVRGLGDDLLPTGGVEYADKWREYLEYNIRELGKGDILVGTGLIAEKSSYALRERLVGLRAKAFHFGLCHGDFSLANVILDHSFSPYIIDWGSAQGHVVPHYDIGIILEESLDRDSSAFRALLRGYGLSWAEFSEIEEDTLLLRKLEAVDKLRWAIDKSLDRVSHYKELVSRLLG